MSLIFIVFKLEDQTKPQGPASASYVDPSTFSVSQIPEAASSSSAAQDEDKGQRLMSNGVK